MGLLLNINKRFDEIREKSRVEKVMKSTYSREKKEHGRFGDIAREEAEKLKKKIKKKEFIDEELQKECSIEPIEEG